MMKYFSFILIISVCFISCQSEENTETNIQEESVKDTILTLEEVMDSVKLSQTKSVKTVLGFQFGDSKQKVRNKINSLFTAKKLYKVNINQSTREHRYDIHLPSEKVSIAFEGKYHKNQLFSIVCQTPKDKLTNAETSYEELVNIFTIKYGKPFLTKSDKNEPVIYNWINEGQNIKVSNIEDFLQINYSDIFLTNQMETDLQQDI